jgi:hypothetical protein
MTRGDLWEKGLENCPKCAGPPWISCDLCKGTGVVWITCADCETRHPMTDADCPTERKTGAFATILLPSAMVMEAGKVQEALMIPGPIEVYLLAIITAGIARDARRAKRLRRTLCECGHPFPEHISNGVTGPHACTGGPAVKVSSSDFCPCVKFTPKKAGKRDGATR